MASQEQLDILKQGSAAWNKWRKEHPDASVNLSGVQFLLAQLPGVDLSNANLSNAAFDFANLSDANLSGANLSRAGLTASNLYHANLEGANLTGAFLEQANMSGANLSGTDLSNAHLRQIGLDLVNLKEAKLWNADLSGVNFSGEDLWGFNLRGADLSGANFHAADLRGANLSDTDLRGAKFSANLSHMEREELNELDPRDWDEINLDAADLRGADLSRAFLSEVNLSGVLCGGANLSGADLSGANLNVADFSGANLSGAILHNATLLETNLEKADLTGCSIYGISVWNARLNHAIQSSLIVTRSDEPTITVDNLAVAQFIYLLLNNENIRSVIDTITYKVILILGRFTPVRKNTLEALRMELRKHNYLPVLFDFDKPTSRDLTETVSILAHLARFIIVDLTEPSSAPHEVATVIPQTVVPVQPLLALQPLIVDGKAVERREYTMFEDLRRRYHWVLPTFRYQDTVDLLVSLKEHIIEPAEEKAKELAQQ